MPDFTDADYIRLFNDEGFVGRLQPYIADFLLNHLKVDLSYVLHDDSSPGGAYIQINPELTLDTSMGTRYLHGGGVHIPISDISEHLFHQDR